MGIIERPCGYSTRLVFRESLGESGRVGPRIGVFGHPAALRCQRQGPSDGARPHGCCRGTMWVPCWVGGYPRENSFFRETCGRKCCRGCCEHLPSNRAFLGIRHPSAWPLSLPTKTGAKRLGVRPHGYPPVVEYPHGPCGYPCAWPAFLGGYTLGKTRFLGRPCGYPHGPPTSPMGWHPCAWPSVRVGRSAAGCPKTPILGPAGALLGLPIFPGYPQVLCTHMPSIETHGAKRAWGSDPMGTQSSLKNE